MVRVAWFICSAETLFVGPATVAMDLTSRENSLLNVLQFAFKMVNLYLLVFVWSIDYSSILSATRVRNRKTMSLLR